MHQIRIRTISDNGGVIQEGETRIDVRDVTNVPSFSWKDEVGNSFANKVREASEQLERTVDSACQGIESLGFSLDPDKASYDQAGTRRYIASLTPRKG